MFQLFEHLSDLISLAISTYLGPIANFLAGYIWNWPPQAPLLAIFLLGTGLFVTIRLGFIQIRGFKHAIGVATGRYDDPDDAGDLKHYQALTTALSATVGIGNIAGVAIAIRLGGPGALFWMWITAFFGMALKFVECTLSLEFRDVHSDGSVSGGPMYYIEKGLGSKWKWMAIFFAVCAVISSFGMGNMNQSNTISDQINANFGINPIWTAIICAFIVGLVIIGGIRRIGRVTAILAPFMALMYVIGALIILFINYTEIPSGLLLIVKQAFAPHPLVGGAVGSFLITLMWGVRRGLFSNEAGLGSAPIAHAAAKTKEPVREGLVASLGPFIDTLVICTMTGLVIVMSGAWKDKVEKPVPLKSLTAVLSQTSPKDQDLQRLRKKMVDMKALTQISVTKGIANNVFFVYSNAFVTAPHIVTEKGENWSGKLLLKSDGAITPKNGQDKDKLTVRGGVLLTGAPLTALGFRKGLGKFGNLIVTFAVLLFAISTSISWSYYGDRATEYLFGSKAIPIYRWIFVFIFFIGAILPLEAVWTFGDVALGLMAFPNLIALLFLSGKVTKMTKIYLAKMTSK